MCLPAEKIYNHASLWACGAPRFGWLHQASTKKVRTGHQIFCMCKRWDGDLCILNSRWRYQGRNRIFHGHISSSGESYCQDSSESEILFTRIFLTLKKSNWTLLYRQRPCPAGFVLGVNQMKEFKVYTGAYHILLIANKSRIKCSKGALWKVPV